MKTPIIIEDGGDFSFFASKEYAEISLEAIDVRNGIYNAYDSDGSLLSLKVVISSKNTFFGLLSTQYERVIIEENTACQKGQYSAVLETKLRDYLVEINESEAIVKRLSLSELVALCIEKGLLEEGT